jgi:hypothetical protein
MIENALRVLLKSSFDSITSVTAVRGKLLDDGQPALIEITNVSLDQEVITKLNEALTHLLVRIPFTVSATGNEYITPTSDPEIAMAQVIAEQNMRQAHDRAALDERHASMPDDPEEWRYIRDGNGNIIDYIYAE